MIKRYTRKEIGSIWKEETKFAKWLDVEIAACEALAHFNIIPKSVPQTVKRKAKFDVTRVKAIEAKVKHDVIAFLTNVAEHVGPQSRYIHYGLTSSDVLDTALALQLKDASAVIRKLLVNLIRELEKLAKRHKYTLMVGRSHGIHAEPITFGLKMLLFCAEFKRDLERFDRAADSVAYGKISGSVGTFAYLDPNIESYICKKLGLKPAPVSNQIIQRDRHAEYLSTIAIIGGSLEKLAVEIRHLQRTEVQEAAEYFSKGQKGSSSMPHKRNPITCERITGLARILRANAMAAMENMTLWHERDISHSSVERVIFPDSTIALDYMLSLMVDLVANMQVYKDTMKKNLGLTKGMIFSQSLMLRLIQKGLTREEAYAIVQNCSKATWEKGAELYSSVVNDPTVTKLLSIPEIESVFDYNYYIRNVDKIFKRFKTLTR